MNSFESGGIFSMAIVPSPPDPTLSAASAKKKTRPSFWLWKSFTDDLRTSGERLHRLAAWWQHWRKTSSFLVLLTFLVLYGLLATLRQPSEVVVEQSRHAEEIAFLQNFLKSYCAAGGTVFAERSHGGAELYPRGVLLQGDLLDAFNRAAVGNVFVARVRSPAWNPLEAFYGFPPIYAGGGYFHLERKFNLALYRCSFLVRKDTPQAGALLLARVEPAY